MHFHLIRSGTFIGVGGCTYIANPFQILISISISIALLYRLSICSTRAQLPIQQTLSCMLQYLIDHITHRYPINPVSVFQVHRLCTNEEMGGSYIRTDIREYLGSGNKEAVYEMSEQEGLEAGCGLCILKVP